MLLHVNLITLYKMENVHNVEQMQQHVHLIVLH